MTNKERIQAAALEVLEQHPKGIRYSQLQIAVKAKLPDVPANTIQGNTWNLELTQSEKVTKPARGLYLLKKFLSTDGPPPIDKNGSIPVKKVREVDFYDSFADWLINDVEECYEGGAGRRKPIQGQVGNPRRCRSA